MLEYFKDRDLGWAIPNIWLGTSVENQQTADERIPLLLQVPAAVRFLSCEPLLGPVDLSFIRTTSISGIMPLDSHPIGSPDKPFINWVIAGGESGNKARPMHPDWVRSLRNQCASASVPFFFKQWGEFAQAENFKDLTRKAIAISDDGGLWNNDWGFDVWEGRNFTNLFKLGKHRSGNFLDGKQHLEFPQPVKP